MNIGVDMRAAHSFGGGVGRYHDNLLRSLRAVDPINEYVELNRMNKAGEKSETIFLKTRDFLKRYISTEYSLQRKGIDLYHTSNFDVPTNKRVRVVLTIHDLAYLMFPEIMPVYLSRYLKRAGKHAAKRADAIIAVSNATKEDICQNFGIEESKIHVVYEGADHLSDIVTMNSSQELEMEGDYLLFVGTIEPRKNLENLARAFDILVKEKSINGNLVIVGKKGYNSEEIVEQINSYKNLEGRIIFRGHVKDEELVSLYRKAKMFIMPSIYEGFGIPALEAMKLGCPVACSFTSSLPEVVGDAGVFFNPHDPEDIAQIVFKAISDEATLARMSDLGRERAESFTWSKAARETKQIFDMLY